MSTIRPAHKAVIPAAGLGTLAPRHIVAEAAGAGVAGALVVRGRAKDANAEHVDRIPEPAVPREKGATHRLRPPLVRRPGYGAVFRSGRYDGGERGNHLRPVARPASERPDAGPDSRRPPEDFVAGGG
jgi:hypothetical protein